MTKTQLRKQILLRRDALTTEERTEYSRRITQTLTSLPEFIAARTIHSYLSFGSEVETSFIRSIAFASGKQVAVPVHEKDNSSLKHCFITENQKFTSGQWNVPIPIGDDIELLSSSELGLSVIDIIIVPLVAFDQMKHRLGYGKGFYDRFLSTVNALKIGIGFSLQEADSIPIEPHDEILSIIITENVIL
ncbi:MAG: 5-formyltetrahydrofolate cyclo-ligase [Bacteroidetes bacterium]|nr:5-formyltetrahydrofolate cyclo-ligase [Bacteroidota bacterium]